MASDHSTPASTQNERNKPVVGARLASESGRQYSIECVLQEKDDRPEKVYLASYVIEYSISSLPPVIQQAYFVLETQQR